MCFHLFVNVDLELCENFSALVILIVINSSILDCRSGTLNQYWSSEAFKGEIRDNNCRQSLPGYRLF